MSVAEVHPQLRLLTAPSSAPPFDDEQPDGTAPWYRPLRAVGVQLPLEEPLPAAPSQPRRLRLVGAEPTPGSDPVRAGGRISQAVLEVLAGARPVAQLAPVAHPDVTGLLTRRLTVAARSGLPARSFGRITSVHVSLPADDVAEVCAVTDDGRRVRALALQLRLDAGRWRCTALQIC